MDPLFSRLGLADVRGDVLRNIVSLRASQDLFDDLTDEPAHWLLAQQVEDAVKPPPYRSNTPVIDRPFEDAVWFDAIRWPFTNWRVSRFSDGSFGAWYGCDSVETSVYETAYHWVHGLLTDAGYESEQVVGERKVYSVACNAALLDFRKIVPDFPELAHKTDYSYAQSVGARIHREGHPGLLIPSVRYASGESCVVFNPAVLSNPRMHCQLTYRLDGGRIIVEKVAGKTWLDIEVAEL
ncbi:MAG: RES family NAD+ phosphorylase [Azoarcus sp.]|nr:RES family NAD+ phosphorylase [Azoarcus sp.]